MFSRAGLAALPQLLRTLRPAPVAAMSTGTFVVSQPLNYRGGARVEPADASGTEKAFEPATGNGTGTGGGAGVRAGPQRTAGEQGTAGAWRAGSAWRDSGLTESAKPGGGSRAPGVDSFLKPGPGAERRLPEGRDGRPLWGHE